MATLADLLRAGYVPPKESALADPIKEHFKSLPQKFEENQRAQMDLLARAYPGNTFKSNMLEGDPAAMSELAMQAPVGGMIAFHGTPHKILGKFDISKVGTGEGAQAYGHGMYFAEAKPVAMEYAKENLKYPNTPLGDAQLFLRQNLFNYDVAKKDIVKNLEALEKFGKNKFGYEESKAKYQETLNLLNKGNVPKLEGNLYKVDIPDADIPNMLDWDKPLSQQSDQVKKGLDSLINSNEWSGQFKKELERVRQTSYFDGNDLYAELIKAKSPQEVSKMLNEYGIKGIRYKDAMSRKANEGTSNFVVFEPSTVKILEENSKPLTRKEVIEQELKKRVE